MTARGIQEIVRDLYGVEISARLISRTWADCAERHVRPHATHNCEYRFGGRTIARSITFHDERSPET